MKIFGLEVSSSRLMNSLRQRLAAVDGAVRYYRSVLTGVGTHGSLDHPLGHHIALRNKVRPNNPDGPLGEGPLNELREYRRYSRALCRETEYSGYIRRIIDDVIPREQRPPKFGEDVPPALAREVQEEWMEWWTGPGGVDGSGLTGPGQERSALWAMVEDGDAFALPWVEDGRLRVETRNGGDLYDRHTAVPTRAGRVVYLGIEMDDRMRPVAYWFREKDKSHSAAGLQGSGGKVRVPAENVIHCFEKFSTDMFRGLPWLTGVMSQALQVKEADLSTSNILAAVSKIPWTMTRPQDAVGSFGNALQDGGNGYGRGGGRDDIIFAGGSDKDAGDDGKSEIKVDGGTVLELPPGAELKHPGVDLPAANTGGFRERMVKTIAAGAMLSYARISGDVEKANFSALRAGEIDDIARARQIHDLWIAQWRRPLFNRWLLWAMGNGHVRSVGRQRVLRALMRPAWIQARREWVAPEKQAAALDTYVRMGVLRPSEVREQMGLPPDPELEKMATEKWKNDGAPKPPPAKSGIDKNEGSANNEDDGQDD